MAALQKHSKYCNDTIALKTTLEEGFLVLGERLAKVRDEELYKPTWDAFEDFLEEMHLSPATASKLINIYLKLVIEFKIPKTKLLEMGGWSDLSEILPLVKNKGEAEEMIDNLAPLNRQHRRGLLTEKKTGVIIDNCKHKDTYTIKICRTCGDREKIYE